MHWVGSVQCAMRVQTDKCSAVWCRGRVVCVPHLMRGSWQWLWPCQTPEHHKSANIEQLDTNKTVQQRRKRERCQCTYLVTIVHSEPCAVSQLGVRAQRHELLPLHLPLAVQRAHELVAGGVGLSVAREHDLQASGLCGALHVAGQHQGPGHVRVLARDGALPHEVDLPVGGPLSQQGLQIGGCCVCLQRGLSLGSVFVLQGNTEYSTESQ